MKNLLLTIPLGFSLFSCKQKTQEYEKHPCVILSVKHYGVGERNTLQINPQWIVTTKCGSFTLRKPAEVGDTIWVHHLK